MKIGGIIIGSALAIVLILFGLYKSSLGEKFVFSKIKDKIKFINNMDVSYLKYNFNSFSLILQKGSNKIYMYGDLFPFNGIYEANLNNLEEITDDFRGSFISKGSFKYSGYMGITGNAEFAGGYSNLRLQCLEKCIGILSGDEFNSSKLLYMTKIEIPHLKLNGKNNLNLVIKHTQTDGNIKYYGDVEYLGLLFKDVLANVVLDIKNRNNFNVKVYAKNNDALVKLDINKKPDAVLINGNIKIKLQKLLPVTYFPLHSTRDFKIFYDYQQVLKFEDDGINGLYSDGKISININSLPSGEFFNMIGIKPFVRGKVNGSITVGKNREYDFLISNARVLDNKLIRFLKRYLPRKINSLDVVLVKGTFDKNKTVFNLIAKNNSKNLLISIQNGVYFYNGNYRFRIEVMAGSNKYVFNVTNSKINIVKIIKNSTKKQEVLVY